MISGESYLWAVESHPHAPSPRVLFAIRVPSPWRIHVRSRQFLDVCNEEYTASVYIANSVMDLGSLITCYVLLFERMREDPRMGTDDLHRGRAIGIQGRGVYLVALTLTLLSMAACGVRTGVPAASTHATTTPMPRLAFRSVALPAGVDPRLGSVAVSPVDGEDAWACLGSGNGAFQIWATTDEGSTWHAAGLLHPKTPEQPWSCQMLADQHDTKAAVFVVMWGTVQLCNQAGMSFYTRDGGQHWQQLPDWTSITWVDTDGPTSYALITIITPSAGQPRAALLQRVSPPRLSAPGPCPGPVNQARSAFVVSRDGLQTWRELHPGSLISGDGGVFQLWYGPTSGEIFAATYNGGLWHSLNGGASWTQTSMPVSQVSLGRWLAGRQAWMFCGLHGQPPVTMCGTDAGNIWRQVPALTFTTHVQCDAWCHKKGGQDSQTSICPMFALAPDGSLLSACPLDSTAPGPRQFMAYRFAPGAAAWAVLGTVPAELCSVSANGIMWCQHADDAEWETGMLPI